MTDLLPTYATYAELFAALRMKDPDQELAEVQARFEGDGVTVNDLRAANGMGPLPNGDVTKAVWVAERRAA